MEDREDEPLTFPLQASLTVLTPEDPSLTPSQSPPPAVLPKSLSADLAAFRDSDPATPTGLVSPTQEGATVRHTASVPISLELFGVEDQPDVPIELVAPVFQTRPSTVNNLPVLLDSSTGHELSAVAVEPSFRGLPSSLVGVSEPAESAADYPLVLTKLMQVGTTTCSCA